MTVAMTDQRPQAVVEVRAANAQRVVLRRQASGLVLANPTPVTRVSMMTPIPRVMTPRTVASAVIGSAAPVVPRRRVVAATPMFRLFGVVTALGIGSIHRIQQGLLAGGLRLGGRRKGGNGHRHQNNQLEWVHLRSPVSQERPA